jgi:DNA repair protein RadC
MLPREKLIKYGAKYLAEYELLAIILGVGSSEENVFDLAKKIIDSCSNIKELLNLTYEELIEIKGIKQAKATKIIASIEFAKRIFEYKPSIVKLDNPKAIYSFMRLEFENKTHEEFFVLYLDKRLRLIKKELLAIGSDDILIFEVKEIFKIALKINSSNIVLIHNHPSGILKPSQSDLETTNEVVKIGKTLDITLIDHVIISNEGYYSFLENHNIE